VPVLVIPGCAAPAVPSSAPAAPTISKDAISRSQAVEVARDALQAVGGEWTVAFVQVGSLGKVMPGWEDARVP
jgi:hypothetical protein